MTQTAQPPWIIAHRGARDEAPENTRSAFERALAYLIYGIELDVQLSADEHLVVYHDWTTYRLNRRRNPIFNLTLAQLRKLDWGQWFHPDFKGEPMPDLAQILARLGPRTRWLIEIKAHPREQAIGRANLLTEKVLTLLDTFGGKLTPDQIHILSFDPEVLTHAARIAPQHRYVLNLAEKEPDAIMKAGPQAIRHLWAIDGAIAALTPDLVAWARKKNLRVFTYTCNTPRQVQKALDLGVDGIITDRPGSLTRDLKILNSRQGTTE